MLVKALANFAGKVSMCVGEIKEIADKRIATDLLKAGHVEEVKAQAEKKEAPAQVEKKTATKKSQKKKK